MNPLIETYHEVYADDLEARIGVNGDRVTTALGVATLLNPMFGLKPKVVGSELMSGDQYDKARVELICQMQDIMDDKYPPVYSLSDSDSSEIDSDDEELPGQQNMNYNKSETEMICFDNYKKKKYHPTICKSKSKILAGQEKEIWVGPPDKRGKKLLLGRNLFGYLCTQRGRMKLLKLFADHKKVFPTLRIGLQRNVSR